jgi:hypothetical protein
MCARQSQVKVFSFELIRFHPSPSSIPTSSGKSRYTRYNVDYQALSPLHEPLQTLLQSRYNSGTDMSVLTVEIPDAVRAALDAAALRQQKSAEQVASESLARVVRAQEQPDYLAQRAGRGHRGDFDAFLAKVPDVPALPEDEL